MSQQENVGESRTASFRDGHDRARSGMSMVDPDAPGPKPGEWGFRDSYNPCKGDRTVGFGDLDYEHGAKGPRYGSDENDLD